MSFSAEIISVGTELLLGDIVNSNAQMLSQGLSEIGISVYFHTVVGDNRQRLSEAVNFAKKRSDIIITTGGLGPTYDDLTKEVLAECFDRKLVLHEDSKNRIFDFFRKIGTKMTSNNKSQAMIPQGAEVFQNDWGTAPGVAFEQEGKYIIMLPGPPAECSMMFHFRVVPYLERITNRVIFSKSIKIFGMGESAVDKKIGKMMLSMKNPTVAPYAKTGEVMLRVTASAQTKKEAEELINPVLAEICRELGDVVYGIDVSNLEEVALESLRKSGKTLAVAESCTGGMLAKRLTDIPGASNMFLGGLIAYNNAIKTRLLEVSETVLTSEGAVSEATAIAMAKGVRNMMGADIGISITGIAGPDGGVNSLKPVGTVFIALDTQSDTVCSCFSLWGNRERIRYTASSNALDMLRRNLMRQSECVEKVI